MVLKIVEEIIPIGQETRYREITYIDAITDKDEAVKVINTRRIVYHTESEVDAQIVKWQGLKDEITALKE